MNLIAENQTRKVDALGRVIIPKNLRQRLRINEGDEVEYYVMEHEGRSYLCLAHESSGSEKYRIAAQVLEELGAEIPDALLEKTI